MSRVPAPWLALLSLAFVVACDGSKKPATTGSSPPPAEPPDAEPPGDPPPARTVVVPVDHPQRGRLEGDGPDACSADPQCFTGGCSSEVCSAQEGVITTCEVVPRPGWPSDAACGCVSGSCQWWSASGATLPAPPDGPGHPPGAEEGGEEGGTGDCGGETCTAPRECISYYGIAGPSGPQFHSCEIPCKHGSGTKGCPKGQTCVTIADGPGSVCRDG